MEMFLKDKLSGGLARIGAKLKAFGGFVRGVGLRIFALGTAAIAPLLAATRVFSALGDDVAKMAKRIGISVESLSELRFAADRSGASVEEFENGIRKMQRTITDASEGSKMAADSLAMVGLTVEQLAGLSPDEQFAAIADGLSEIEDPTTRAAAAMEIFGRSGTKLIPLMEDGAAGINALRREARELGLTMSSEDAAAAEVFADQMGDLWSQIKMAAFQVGAALAPVLVDLVTAIKPVLKSVIDWIKENRPLIVSIAGIAVGVVATGAALFVAGSAISLVGGLIGGLVTVVGALIVAIKATIAFLVAFGPVLLGVGAIVGSIGFVILDSIGVIERFGQVWRELKDTAVTAVGGIVDALKAGRLELAAKIAWVGVKLVWKQGIAFIKEAFIRFYQWLVHHAVRVVTEITGIFREIVDADFLREIDAMAKTVETVFSVGGNLVIEADKGEIQALRAELAKLRTEAAEAARAAGGPKPGTPEAYAHELRNNMRKQVAEIGVSGTFSATAVMRGGLQAGDVSDELKRQTALLREIRDGIDEQAVFTE